MSVEIAQKQSQELAAKLWDIANELRNNMDSSKFKNYILGVIFYRYLSEKTETYMNDLLKNDGITYREALENEEFAPTVREWSIEHLGYVIEPQYLYDSMIAEIEDKKFTIEKFEKAVSSLIASTLGQESEPAFEKLFDDMNLQDKDLGKEVSDRTKLISTVMQKVNDISFNVEDAKIDVLGTAYMILIGLFASDAGKKGGEFYTSEGPALLLARLATVGLDEVKSACDPCAGSGSLLLRVQDELSSHKVGHFYADEMNGSNPACDFLSGSFIDTLQSHFPAPRTEHDNRFQQVGFRCAPEMVILAAFSSILHQSVHEFHRADLANVASLGVVNLGNAIPCVAPLRRHKVEHLHFVAFQPEFFRCAFVQLSFWVGNYYAFPTHNRLKDGVTNIAERFACTGRTENEDVSVSFGVLRQTNNLFASFGILTEDNATSVVDVADFVLLFRFFAGHPFGCAICAFAGIVNTTGVAALDNVQFSVFSKHDESNPRHHPAEYQSIQPASDGGNAGHKMHQRRLHHGVG